jgi:hypothetical protein
MQNSPSNGAFFINTIKETYMSPINSALQYKIQKMEKQLSSLMEENAALRNIINEEQPNPGQPLVHGVPPSNPFSGQMLASLLAGSGNSPTNNYGQMYANQYTQGYPQTLSGGYGGPGSVPATTSYGSPPALRSAPAQAQTTGGGGFDGAAFGQFLAGLGNNPQAQQMVADYLSQFPAVATGAQTAAGGRRNTNNLSTRR